MRQITAAIQIEKFNTARLDSSKFSWLARALGTLIVGGYMAEGDGVSKAMDHANSLSFDDIEASQIKWLQSHPPEDTNAPAQFTEEGEPIAYIDESKLKIGSYERLMGAGIGRTRG